MISLLGYNLEHLTESVSPIQLSNASRSPEDVLPNREQLRAGEKLDVEVSGE